MSGAFARLTGTLLTGALLAPVACQLPACDLGAPPNVGIVFRTFVPDAVTGEPTDVGVQVRLVRINAVGRENLLPDEAAANPVAQWRLPLPADGGQVTYELERIDGQVDTVALTFEPVTVLVSHACGFRTQYDSLRVQATSFDSVRVEIADVVADNETNLVLYYF